MYECPAVEFGVARPAEQVGKTVTVLLLNNCEITALLSTAAVGDAFMFGLPDDVSSKDDAITIYLPSLRYLKRVVPDSGK
jgi:hypothetical protein